MQDICHLIFIFLNVIDVFINHLYKVLLEGKLLFEKFSLLLHINVSFSARLQKFGIDVFERNSVLLLL